MEIDFNTHKKYPILLQDLYLPRWELFFAEQESVLKGNPAKVIDYFKMEKDWTEKQNVFPYQEIGNSFQEIRKVISKSNL